MLVTAACRIVPMRNRKRRRKEKRTHDEEAETQRGSSTVVRQWCARRETAKNITNNPNRPNYDNPTARKVP
jgi:hypothetical protein